MNQDAIALADATDVLSFTAPSIQSCPFAAYDHLRDREPVYKDPVTGNYILTRYQDVRRVLLDVKTFSSRSGLGASRANAAREEVDQIYDAHGWRPMDTLQSQDPPEHRTYRQLVDKAFAPAKILALEPRINEIIHGLIDGLIETLGAHGEIEFVADFAIKLPMIVIAEQLGVRSKDMDRFKIWSDAVVLVQDPTLSRERQIEVAHTCIEMQRYFADAIAQVRREPNEQLLSRLVHAEVDGRRLEMGELQSIMRQLIVAGNETTTTTLAAGMKLLAEDRDIVSRLRGAPDLLGAFVEETLRAMSPVQTLFRRVMEDTDIAGVTIPAGAMVEVRYGAANRDPAVFAEPEKLDLARQNVKSHLAFGFGPHICIGNQLARGELRLAFQCLIERLDKFRLSRGENSYVFIPNYVVYGMTKLWISADKH
ncbi:cytochrome P450 [Aliidongia dinghuensis]|uniref:Cytochrome P450 n=1 Tax=Aliidongia dinghuensis TaxID=1867774 RepID=A0A8J2Z119_9PROT|nr:cytochrome P450 [Aliidongia dinghuensis]GGF49389.1 cytochrome P450 [Aliidongia dinghuensis]